MPIEYHLLKGTRFALGLMQLGSLPTLPILLLIPLYSIFLTGEGRQTANGIGENIVQGTSVLATSAACLMVNPYFPQRVAECVS